METAGRFFSVKTADGKVKVYDNKGWRFGDRRVRPRVVLVHALCWLLFAAYELSLLYYSVRRLEPALNYVLFYALNIAFFYGHAALLDHTFSGPKARYLSGVIRWLLLFAGYLLLKRILDHLLDPAPATGNWTLMSALPVSYLFRGTYMAILSTAYWASGYRARYRRQALAAENAYLQQQVNPHLLFNTLNFIYSGVYEKAPEAGRSVLLLSDIVRFGLEAAGPDGKCPVAEELLHIEQLIAINRGRFDHDLQLRYEVTGDPEGQRVIPLVLMTLTENVFKHGNLEAPALIRITTGGDQLHFYSRNEKKAKSAFKQTARLGLRNIRLRLDYSYHGRYALAVTEDDHLYELNLHIRL